MVISFGYQWPPPNNDVLGYSASSQKPRSGSISVCDAGLWPSREVAPEDPHVIVVGGDSAKSRVFQVIVYFCL